MVQNPCRFSTVKVDGRGRWFVVMIHLVWQCMLCNVFLVWLGEGLFAFVVLKVRAETVEARMGGVCACRATQSGPFWDSFVRRIASIGGLIVARMVW